MSQSRAAAQQAGEGAACVAADGRGELCAGAVFPALKSGEGKFSGDRRLALQQLSPWPRAHRRLPRRGNAESLRRWIFRSPLPAEPPRATVDTAADAATPHRPPAPANMEKAAEAAEAAEAATPVPRTSAQQQPQLVAAVPVTRGVSGGRQQRPAAALAANAGKMTWSKQRVRKSRRKSGDSSSEYTSFAKRAAGVARPSAPGTRKW
uniref:Uncharacterized protein n=1 Tax=Macrostomum lignano TaxID=282301 RepID=A0A1I8F547_9PLAT